MRSQPEVSAGFPVVSKDGKTYTFTIKSGFRFSNGQGRDGRQLQDGDRPPGAAEARVLHVLPGFRHHRRHAGGARRQGAERLRRDREGQQADDQADPSGPDLLARLATPPFQAIPASLASNVDPAGVNTYASCGPYYYAARTPNRSITIKRNPFYKGSRPHNATTIQVNIGNSPDVIYQDVVKGTTDYAEDGVTPTLYASIAKTYGINKKQFFLRPELEVDYLALNHDPGRMFHEQPEAGARP